MPLEKKNRALLVKLFYQKGENALAALREYRRLKRLRRGPLSRNGLQKMITRFEETGELTVALGRGRRPVNEEIVDEIAVAMADSTANAEVPEACSSARAVARQLSLSWSTVRKVLRSILRYYPYKIHMVQELKPQDARTRTDFAYWFLARMGVEEHWPNNVLWTDEAHFTLAGSVNSQNCRIWGASNPHAVHEKPLHSTYVTVWCGFTSHFILGPFFFEEATPTGPVRCSVTSARYRDLLAQRIIPALQERGCLQNTVFMQDGTPPHIGRPVTRLLRDTFGDDRIISRSFPYAWPPRSPDLNPCDFWLWGYLKDRVYQGNIRSLPELKSSITAHVSTIPPEMLRATVDHVVLRMQHVIDLAGTHIEQAL